MVRSMAGSGTDVFWVLMPPEFHYLGDLFLPDPFRARTSARIALEAGRLKSRGHTVLFEPGMLGFTIPQTISLLLEGGVKQAAVAGMHWEEKSALSLHDALNAAGVACGRPLLSRKDGRDILTGLSKRVEGRARMDLAFEISRPLPAPGCAAFLILEEGEPLPDGGAAFRREGADLLRAGPGRAPGIPPWVDRIRMIAPEDRSLLNAGHIDENTLVAFSLAEADEAKPDWLNRCDEIIEQTGPERFRLSPASQHAPPSRATGGATWAPRYGLLSTAFRKFLSELLRRHFPERLALYHAVLGFLETGVDPLEEMYAGCGLLERNQELIENIVP